MSSGIAYPPPTYIPPLPIFNPLFFPQSFDTTTTSGGGGGFTNIFPNGLTSGNVITMDGGTGGGGGTGVERTITGISYLDFVDSAETDPTNITGYITLNGNTLEIGSNTALSGINVNLLGSVVSANGVAIATGGNVSNDISNNFLVGTTQTFSGEIVVDNLQSNIGQLSSNNTGLGGGVFSNLTSGVDNSIFGYHSALALTTGGQNVSIGKSSLVSLTTGQGNTAVGWGSMGAVVSSNYNTAIGNLSAYSLTSGTQNTSIGYQTGGYMTTGSNNVSIGYLSGVSPSAPTLSDTIAIGNFAYADATGDIILGNSGNYNSTTHPYYAKFTPNTSGSGVILQGTYNNSSNITIAGNIIQIKSPTGSTNAGQLQILGGTNGGGSLQVQNSATNPPTTAGFGNFASISGDPFYYSPSSSSWLELTTQSIGNKIVSLPSNNGIAGGLGTQWQITPLVLQPISTNPTPPYGTTFSYTLYTNLTPTPQTINSALTQLNIQGLYTSITGTGVAQQYTYTPNGITYWGYVLSSTINCIGALTDLQFQKNLAGNNNNFYFTCSSTDASLLTTTLQLIIRPNP